MFQSKVCPECMHNHSDLYGHVLPGDRFHRCSVNTCPVIPRWRRIQLDKALSTSTSIYSARRVDGPSVSL